MGADLSDAIEAQQSGVEYERAAVGCVWFEVNHNNHAVAADRIVPAPCEEVLAVYVLEDRRPVEVARRFAAADLVEACDEWREALGSSHIPSLHLIFLRVEIFLAARLPRRCLEEFHCWPVDPPIASREGCQREPHLKHRPFTSVQCGVKNVGRVGPKVWAKEFRDRGRCHLVDIVGQFLFCSPPCEVCVRLSESEFGKAIHRFGPRKSLCQKEHIGVCAVNIGDQPLPECKRFGVGIVDPEDPHPLLHPKPHNVTECIPELSPVVALEIKWHDVLIFLWGIFSVLNRAVAALSKPLRMLLHPRVIRRTLHGQIQGQFQAERLRPAPQSLKILKVPQ